MVMSVPNVNAKVFTIQNESTNMFVVNGSSGNILLNPNAGFGNVGIGTTVPPYTLSVVGNSIQINASTAQAYFRANGRGIGNDAANVYSTNGTNRWSIGYLGASIAADGNFNIYDYDGTAGSRFTIDNGTGNVGIGTTSPNYILQLSKASSSTNQFSTSGQPTLSISNTDTTTNNWATIQFNNINSSQTSTAIQTKFVDHVNNYGELHFATRGASNLASRMMIDQNGNVGIGTTSPAARLDITRTDSTAEMLMLNNSGANSNPNLAIRNPGQQFDIQVVSARNNNFEVMDANAGSGASAVRFVIANATGNVGIGTTTPNYLLQVASGTDGRSVNLSNVLYVNGSSGNVGIGTTSPLFKLQIAETNGGTSAAMRILGGSSGIEFLNDSTGNRAWHIGMAPRGSTADTDLVFSAYGGTSWSERVRITNAGNVGIGTTTPTTALEVAGNITVTNSNILMGRTHSSAPEGLVILTGGDIAKPPCTSNLQGAITYEQYAAQSGHFYGCIGQGGGTYNWVQLDN